MTAEEKIEKLVAFVRKVESIDSRFYDIFSLDDIECNCPECGSKSSPSWPRNARADTEYIDMRVIDDIKDQAWHVLADTETL